MNLKPTKTLADALNEVFVSPDNADKVALLDHTGVNMTYGQLSELTEGCPNAGSGQLALITLPISFEGVCRYLQLLLNGFSIIVCSHKWNFETIRQIIFSYAPNEIVLTSEWAVALQTQLSVDYFKKELGDSQFVGFSRVNSNQDFQIRQQLLLLATSGSTGSPKTVRLKFSGVLDNSQDIIHGLSITSLDRAVLTLPLNYTYGLSVLHTHLLGAASVYIPHLSMIQRGFFDELSNSRVTTFAGVPSTYEALMRLGLFRSGTIGIKKFSQAGGRLDSKIVREISQTAELKGFSFQPMYGQTEATARISIMPVGRSLDYPDCVGSIVDSCAVSFGSNEDPREIIFKGSAVMLGYGQNRADISKDDELNGVLYTGDLGENKDGLLKIVGRLRRIIKYRGVRMSLDDIEVGLCSVLGSREVAVLNTDETLKIFCAKLSLNMKSIQSYLNTIGISHRDFEVVGIDSIPLNDSGKVDYFTLGTKK